MKKRNIALSMFGLGMVLSAIPLNVHAWGPSTGNNDSNVLTNGNFIYTYTDKNKTELKSVNLISGATLTKNPAGIGQDTYPAGLYYGTSQNFKRTVYTDIYGQSYLAYAPQGRSLSDLNENTYSQDVNASYEFNNSSNSLYYNNFKKYSVEANNAGGSGATKGGNQSYNGISGNWRYLGYNSTGEDAIINPNFPSDWPTSSTIESYRWASNYSTYKPKISTYDGWEYESRKKQALKDAMAKYNPNTSVSIDTWCNRLSLLTHPDEDTPIFLGYYTNGRYYRNVIGVTKPALVRDMLITSLEVTDSKGNIVGIFTRNESDNTYKYDIRKSLTSGNTYTCKVTVKNTGATMASKTVKVITGGYIGSDASTRNDYSSYYSSNSVSNSGGKGESTVSTNNQLKAGESTTLTFNRTIGTESQNTKYRISAMIHKDHFNNTDSNDIGNDWSKLAFNIDNGNISATKVELIDPSTNKVVDISAPIPGKSYKIRYTYTYTGPDKDNEYSLELTNTVVRTMNNGTTDTYKQTDYVTLNAPKTGDTFTTTTDTLVFETPKVTASSVLEQNSYIDSNKNDNSISKDYTANYNFTVSNVRIIPSTERPTSYPTTLKVTIKYDIDVTVPSYNQNYETDIITNINPNTSFVDHIKAGSNKDITHEIEVTATGTGSIPATVVINNPSDTNQRIWESNYNDNTGKTNGNTDLDIVAPENPYNGGCSLSGVTTSYTASKKHQIHTFSGNYTKGNYYSGDSKADGTSNFYYYNGGSDSSVTTNYTESYKIEKILFRSKLTKDLGLGSDGWVDLKTTKGQIKAGYGYELKIQVSYKTNAITSQPTASRNPSNPLQYHGKNKSGQSTSSGTTVSNTMIMPNLYNDIYVNIGNNKILSVSGIYGTTKAFTAKTIESNNNTVTVEYTLGTTVNGVQTSDKIYTDESTKDGDVSITVFTPNITSISGGNLCDKNTVSYTIKGSMLDDNNDHIVQ